MRGPVPIPTAESGPYWRAAARGRLCLPHCAACHKTLFPPVARCPACLTDKLDWRDIALTATLLEWSRVHIQGPAGLPRPFTVARAALEDAPDAILIATLDAAVVPTDGMRLAIGFDPVDDMRALPILMAPA